MGSSGGPSLDLWPKLRRRIKECKSRKAKSKFNAYASQSLEKFSVVYAELQARRDSVVERIGAPVEIVRSISRSARSRPAPSPLNKSVQAVAKDVAVGPTHHDQCEESESSPSASEVFLESNVNKSDASPTVHSRNVDSGRQGTIELDDPIHKEGAVGVQSQVKREMKLKDGTFGGLDLEGRKGPGRSGKRSQCGRDQRRWRQVNRTAVTFVVILGTVTEKSAHLAGSILAALLLGVVSPCRSGHQHLCRMLSDIILHLRGHLHAHLSGLASKRLDHIACHNVIDAVRLTTPDHVNSSYFPARVSESAEGSYSPVSPGISPASNGHVERPCSLSPSNKLTQFKTKMFKSFSQSKSPREIRAHRASSMPPITTGCEDSQESSLGSQSERWSSNTPASASEEDLGVRCRSSPPDRVVKKKSFLQRRTSLLRTDEEGFDASDVRSSTSFSRSRFGNLRINISHSHDDFGMASPADTSSRSLRIGSLRITTTSMKESPRRSVDCSSSTKRPCTASPGSESWKQLRATGSKLEHATPRCDQSSRWSCCVPSPCLIPPNLEGRIRDMKKRHKYEAFLVVIFLVALLFLVAGRAPAVLATSISLTVLSQLDKFQQTGWDAECASRRTMSVSRKLRASESGFSSPRTPCSPYMGGTISAVTPTPIPNECRRSICMGQFFGRTKRP